MSAKQQLEQREVLEPYHALKAFLRLLTGTHSLIIFVHNIRSLDIWRNDNENDFECDE